LGRTPEGWEAVKAPALRTFLAGIAAGLAMVLAMFLTFGLLGFGWHSRGILLNAAIQSPKLIAVWTTIEPLPLIVSSPLSILPGFLLLGLAHAFVYRWVAPAWPPSIFARAWRMSWVIFLLAFCFFELFTPINQFLEPLPLVVVELLFWLFVAFVEGCTLAWLME
jgi:hypothetical protein